MINTEKRTSKTNISSYLSRSCTTVIDDRFSNTGRTGYPASVAPLTSRPWTSHPEIPEGVPREIDLFSLQFQLPLNKIAHTKPNLTPSVPSDETWTLTNTSEEGYFRAPASVKRRLKVAGRGALVGGFRRFQGWHARQAGRALDTDRVQSGQREESIAQRRRPPPVGKREELRTRAACRSGQREETGGNGGFSSVLFSSSS